jgi:hypothetical protein
VLILNEVAAYMIYSFKFNRIILIFLIIIVIKNKLVLNKHKCNNKNQNTYLKIKKIHIEFQSAIPSLTAKLSLLLILIQVIFNLLNNYPNIK